MLPNLSGLTPRDPNKPEPTLNDLFETAEALPLLSKEITGPALRLMCGGVSLDDNWSTEDYQRLLRMLSFMKGNTTFIVYIDKTDPDVAGYKLETSGYEDEYWYKTCVRLTGHQPTIMTQYRVKKFPHEGDDGTVHFDLMNATPPTLKHAVISRYKRLLEGCLKLIFHTGNMFDINILPVYPWFDAHHKSTAAYDREQFIRLLKSIPPSWL